MIGDRVPFLSDAQWVCDFIQSELVHAQFKRAKEQFDTPDDVLYNDLLSVYSMSVDANVEPVVLRRLAEKLQLMTISDLKQE